MDNRNLLTLKTFVVIYLSWLYKFDLMNGNFLDVAFNKINTQFSKNNQFSKTVLDNFQPTKLDNNKLILEKATKNFWPTKSHLYRFRNN